LQQKILALSIVVDSARSFRPRKEEVPFAVVVPPDSSRDCLDTSDRRSSP
jgi:hypothetical protein